MRRRTRTRKKKSGIRAGAIVLAALCAVGAGGDHKKGATAYALVGGTVFRDPGFALPGAAVVLTLDETGGEGHFKPLKTASDDRGEFVFRLPPVSAHYLLRASAKGYQAAEKKAEVSDPHERVDVNFMLAQESKQEPK